MEWLDFKVEIKNWAWVVPIAEKYGAIIEETTTDILISLQEIERARTEFGSLKEQLCLLTEVMYGFW